VRIFTVGHSTRTLDELIAILAAHGVKLLVDVRRYPASRRHPHFARESLERALPAAGVAYAWVPALGGRRARREDSRHTAWANDQFAGYADHMETPEFEAAARAVIARAAPEGPAAVMCAEAHPSRCHRRLLADWRTAQGIAVDHLLDERHAEPHTLTPFARVEAGRVVYDVGQLPLG
jgi:uncharacterized protein (DUF488 family)